MKKFLFLLLFVSACTNKQKVEGHYRQVELAPTKSRYQYEALGSQYMVSTQGTASTQAGIDVLKKGGNLFDAFAAISFAISVERPHSTGIGGGGFIVFYLAKEKKAYAFDFRETAPSKAHAKMFLKNDGTPDPDLSLTGALSVATPGLVKGVLEVHKKYGKLKLSEVLAPAIKMAEEGIPVYPALHFATEAELARLKKFPSSAKIFLSPEGKPWPVGHILVQKDLAQTLRIISQNGINGFYKGSVGQNIVKTIAENKGILNQRDLNLYKAKWRQPVKSEYGPFQILSQPPPSSGGTHVIQILNTLENAGLKELGPQSPKAIHLTASAMQQAFYDRARFMGDPDFIRVPVEMLTSKEYAEKTRASIAYEKAKKAKDVTPKEESPETTHFSLMDKEGNVISSTQTINGWFGSALVAEGTGIMLNNEMDDFAAQVGASNLYGAIGGEKNLIAPYKRPLSSMSPTIVLQDGKPFMSLGTPSGTRIITCVALTLLNVLEYNLSLWDAVTLTRYHHQWMPDQLMIENSYFNSQTILSLQEMGYEVQEKNLGCRIQAIQKVGDQLHGVSDPREEGSSQGL